MDGIRDHHPRSKAPTVVGTVLLLVGLLALFGVVVGYSWAPHDLPFWERLEEGVSWGIPSSWALLIGVVALVVGLVLIGIGIGTSRAAHHSEGSGHRHRPHAA